MPVALVGPAVFGAMGALTGIGAAVIGKPDDKRQAEILTGVPFDHLMDVAEARRIYPQSFDLAQANDAMAANARSLAAAGMANSAAALAVARNMSQARPGPLLTPALLAKLALVNAPARTMGEELMVAAPFIAAIVKSEERHHYRGSRYASADISSASFGEHEIFQSDHSALEPDHSKFEPDHSHFQSSE